MVGREEKVSNKGSQMAKDKGLQVQCHRRVILFIFEAESTESVL